MIFVFRVGFWRGYFNIHIFLLLFFAFNHLMGLSNGVCYAVTQVVILCFNYWITKKLIFNSLQEPAGRQVIKYLIAVVVFRSIDWSIFMCLNHFLHVPVVVAVFAGMAFVLPVKFFTYKMHVFRDQPEM